MDALNQTIDDIRRYIFDLRSAEQSRALESVLEELVQDLRLDTLLEVDLEVVGQRCCWLGGQEVAHMTQIVREALSNIVQHADASRVTVGLSYLGSATRLTVADDGRGIDLKALSDRDGLGQGITNMQARARTMAAHLDLASEPGKGFKMVLTIPCTNGKTPAVDVTEQAIWL